jgi:hypothetical protein
MDKNHNKDTNKSTEHVKTSKGVTCSKSSFRNANGTSEIIAKLLLSQCTRKNKHSSWVIHFHPVIFRALAHSVGVG